ncbi:MAG: transketolase [Oscillospiraceae bacterium]|nr:transketolase [Oscillospiraceae bacterium]
MDLRKKANERRIDIVNMVYRSKSGHIGGDLSSIDVLCALYYEILNIDPNDPNDPNRDRFIMSKGHCVESLYAVLADIGFFPKEDLDTVQQFGSKYIGHPNKKIPGIEFSTGALGHGLSLGVGVALSGKIYKKNYMVYVLIGDGELDEGSNYEAAMAASHYNLDNLVAIIDRNHLQISGTTEYVMSLEPLAKRWESFGFNVKEIDGNDMDEVINALKNIKRDSKKPSVIISNTIKGKGVSFIENKKEWHHGTLNDEQYEKALNELEGL